MTNGSSAGVSPAASLPVEESSFNVVPELSPSEYSEQVDLPEEYSPSSNEVILSAAQEKRYEFFKSQKQFIRNLTDICDRLRFVEKPCRKDVLQKAMEKLVVPAFCYLPLCKSTDPWRYILQALPEEGHAFTTKARVPALMFFEVEEHPEAMDVASFLALELQEYVTGTDEDVELQRASEDFAANPTRNDTILPSPPSSDSTPRSIGLGSRTSSEERRKSLLVKSTSGASLDSFSSVPPGMERSTSNASAASSNSVAKMVSGESSPMLPKRGSIWKDSLETSAPPPPVSLPSTSAEEEIGVGGGETFEGKSSRIRYVSPYGHLNSWKLDGVLAKSNDDVRQEVFVMQLITYYDRIFKNDKVDVWLHPYRIVSTSKTTGLIQLIPDAMSIDGLKKLDNYPGSLKDYFKMIYKYDVPSTGEEGSNHPLAEYFPKNSSVTYMNAIHAYLQSMAAYSVVTYLIAIKDRHNGNIMIDSHGHVIHIDYGFVFGLGE